MPSPFTLEVIDAPRRARAQAQKVAYLNGCSEYWRTHERPHRGVRGVVGMQAVALAAHHARLMLRAPRTRRSPACPPA